MADAAVSAWLRYGCDRSQDVVYGRVRVSDGSPVLGPKETPYQPGEYTDLWEPLFPTHDYPMPLAESCLTLYQLTRREEYRSACNLWIEQILADLPARLGDGAYAEHYGRALHFLLGCADILRIGLPRKLAGLVAEEALDRLFAHGMFRGHPGEDRYDAVDGVGYLELGLIRLQTGREPDMMGMGW